MTFDRGWRIAHGPAAAYIWKVSPWDHHGHAYRKLGEVTSEAICRHSSRTSALTEHDGTAPECPGCVVAISLEMAASTLGEDANDWKDA